MNSNGIRATPHLAEARLLGVRRVSARHRRGVCRRDVELGAETRQRGRKRLAVGGFSVGEIEK